MILEDEKSIKYELVYYGLVNVIVAHIHKPKTRVQIRPGHVYMMEPIDAVNW
jgi:hypothetical protein